MSKPSIAELLNASGYTAYTPELVQRAMYTLYGNVGANLDERNWDSILQSSNALEAAEAALRTQYQDSGYLLRNTQHLVQSGYVAAQAEITYRQMADRLGYTYNSAWSDGTPYDHLGDLTYEQLVSLVPAPPPPPPLPTISVSASATGFSVALNVAGTVKLSVSGDLGNFAAGSTLLTEQGSVKEGFLTLAANGNTSAATSQYVVLGTSGDDTVDFSALAIRVDYIFGGAGNDTLRGGAGDDVIHGGTGNDHITGGAGVDTLFGGDGNDRFYYTLSGDLFASGQAVDSIDGGAGTNTLVLADGTLGVQNSFDIRETSSWARISNVSRIEAKGPYGAQFNLVLSNDAYEAGLRVIDLSADTYTNLNANFINVSAETGAANGYTLVGHGGTDFITGGAGNDTITGGAGADKINGGAGSDSYKYAVASESTIINAASAATGFDTVTITSGDIFDFISDVTAVRVDEYYVGQSPQANGDALLVQLNSFYQFAGPSAGVDAMYISIGNNVKGRFLVVDTDDNNQITSNDLIIEIVGITANKNIQLGLSGGNLVMNEVDPPSFPFPF